MKNFILVVSLALLFQGCTYAISREYSRQADRSISLSDIMQDPTIYQGRIVIFGGTIVQVSSTDKGTLIEVVARALDYWGRPERVKKTAGRFILLYPAYLNTLLYAPGREITVAASVQGTMAKALEDQDLLFPLFVSKELKLWEDDRHVRTGPQWFDPLYDPRGPQ